MSYRRILCSVTCVLFSTALFFPAFPIAGIGIQWGFDNSLSMPDKVGEQTALNDLSLNVSSFGGAPPTGYKSVLSGADLPITINRTNWQRNWFNFGGKIFIDVIPFINTAELSVNYGMWEYNGSITYPTSISFNGHPGTNIKNIADIQYATTEITSEALGLGNPFVKNTPYAKLEFDLTARKDLLKFPPVVKIFKLYGGAGLSLDFATPLLSSAFIEKTLGTTLAAVHDVNNLQSGLFGQNNDAMVKIGKQFMKDLMTPRMGMHFDLGATIKLPAMPFGIYVDARYLIPFGDLDKNVDDLKATGFCINSGISFSF
ncbi:MAG: hypothetical protein ABSF80_03575 [Chitinispirillaceae bacterium]